ncbi:MAG TPA: DUF1549 domain-containing protein [Pirellulales bacterium]|nr:DUF1549 domain-containing protein [Pirellulales bacterium]
MMRRFLCTLLLGGLASVAAVVCAADKPVSGSHLAESLKRYLGAPDAALKKLDLDSDGRLSKDEFASGLSDATKGRVPASFGSSIFGRIDANHDGALSLDELQATIGAGDEKPTARKPAANTTAEPEAAKPQPATTAVAAAAPKANEPASSARRGAAVFRLLGEPQAAHQKMDSDADGHVTQDEFARHLAKLSNDRIRPEIGGTIFRTFDLNHDGDLTPDELQTASSPAPATSPATTARKRTESPPPATTEPKVALESRPWKSGPEAPFTVAELDQLLAAAQAAEPRPVAKPLGDEQFLRRVTLDLTGMTPTAAEVESFSASDDPLKRAAAINRLLGTDAFAQHWAHFWRDVMQSKASSTQVIFELHRAAALEDWLAERLKHNRSWAEITHGLLTAEGAIFVPADAEIGNVGFLLCHTGSDAEVGRAVDTTRVFLGIQLECAQCHDHPTDIWKREQFHQLAAYFGRLRDGRATGPGRQRGLQLVSAARGEYEMPDKYDSSKTTLTHPKFFLSGEALGEGADDHARRNALAEQITKSPWFAKAFVNRVWAQMTGRGFVEPVDNLGPSQPAIYPEVLDALAASFIASDFNIKELLAVVAGSQAYQRELRLGQSRHEHLHFVGSYPMRLRGQELWDTLTVAVGPFAEKTPLPNGLRQVLERIREPDFYTVFKRLFNYDPTAGANEVEPSVSQALMLMNNPAINAQIIATGKTRLAEIVAQFPHDDDAIRQVYLQVQSRQPSEREFQACRNYLAAVGNRPEALEDLMWVLVNSAEFRTKH